MRTALLTLSCLLAVSGSPALAQDMKPPELIILTSSPETTPAETAVAQNAAIARCRERKEDDSQARFTACLKKELLVRGFYGMTSFEYAKLVLRDAQWYAGR